jgi:hypothetical protein
MHYARTLVTCDATAVCLRHSVLCTNELPDAKFILVLIVQALYEL